MKVFLQSRAEQWKCKYVFSSLKKNKLKILGIKCLVMSSIYLMKKSALSTGPGINCLTSMSSSFDSSAFEVKLGVVRSFIWLVLNCLLCL